MAVVLLPLRSIASLGLHFFEEGLSPVRLLLVVIKTLHHYGYLILVAIVVVHRLNCVGLLIALLLWHF